MSTSRSNDKIIPTNIPADTVAHYRAAVASQEEIYLEETKQKLRTILTSGDPSPHKATAEYWQRK
jgi:hypothetical protein